MLVVTLSPEDTGVVPIIGDGGTVRGAVLKPTLVCVSGSAMGKSFRVDHPQQVLGRVHADIELGDRDISRRHARIEICRNGYEVEDLGSTNGTFVNGRRISARTPVSVGDRIQLGRTVLLFTIQDDLEQRMMSLVRLEAMATLAGGIAHDFNNALAVVMANLDFVAMAVPAHDVETHAALDEMRTATASANSLSRQLLQLGRADTEPFAPILLSQLITQSAAMARHRVKHHVEIRTAVSPNLRVLGSADDLLHVMLNLAYNACDAMPDGGTLTISARSTRLDLEDALRFLVDVPGDYVELCVTDTGHGIDRATIGRVFDPFFTTKPRGKGTGLGLAMVHAAIRRHGGSIEVDSVVGQGTTFRILLPRSEAPVLAHDPAVL